MTATAMLATGWGPPEEPLRMPDRPCRSHLPGGGMVSLMEECAEKWALGEKAQRIAALGGCPQITAGLSWWGW